MEFLVDEKKVRLNPYNMKFSKCIGQGSSAKVYLIGDEAYKLYKPYCGKELITKAKIELFKQVPTKRIILYDKAILDKKRVLQGVVSKYIEDLGIDKFMGSSKQQVLDSINYLIEDAIRLGDYGILLNDVSIENSSFNDGIYFIDSGRYQTINETGYDSNITISYNISTINEFIISQIFGKWALTKYKNNGKKIRDEYLLALSKGESIEEHLFSDMCDETIDQYVKRKVK